MASRGRAVVVLVAAMLGVAVGIVYSSRYPAPSTNNGTPADHSSDAIVVLPPPETFDPAFAPCAHCHQVGPGARHATGPRLDGVMDRSAGATDYPYSVALRESGLTWDEVTLTRFLMHPAETVPGTRMLFAGLPAANAERVVRYLQPMPADATHAAR